MIAALLIASAFAQAQPAAAPPLAAISGAARYRLSASPAMLIEGLDARSQAVFAEALGLADPGIGALWSQVMTGALQVRREAADSADTLWFNPVLDTGLVVRWVREGEGWTAIAAAPVLGETLRGEAGFAAGAPGWATGAGNLGQALKAHSARSFAAADAGSWNRLFEAAPASPVAAVVRPALASRALDRMTGTDGYEGSLRLLHRLLVTDDPAARRLPAALAASLAEFGEAARLTLRPVTALRRADGWTVVLQSPDAPAVAWLAHFTDPATGEPALPAAFSSVIVNEHSESRP
jgi:hypothetical protein